MRDVTNVAVFKFLMSENAEGKPRAMGLADPDDWMTALSKNGMRGMVRCKKLPDGGVAMQATQLASTVRGTSAYRDFLSVCEAYNESIIVWDPNPELRKYLAFRGYEEYMGFDLGEKCEGMRWVRPES